MRFLSFSHSRTHTHKQTATSILAIMSYTRTHSYTHVRRYFQPSTHVIWYKHINIHLHTLTHSLPSLSLCQLGLLSEMDQ